MKLFLSIFLSFFLQISLAAEECGTQITNFENKIELKSGWFYMKGDNPEWKNLDLEDSGWNKKTLPDGAKEKNKDIKTVGYYWYRCRLHFNENIRNINHALAINLGQIRDVDEVYFNGVLIGSTGRATPPSVEVDFEKFRVYSIPERLFQPGANVIAVRIYSANTYYGINEVPTIGNEYKMMRSISNKEIFNIVCAYVFIIMGLFFIIGSIVRSTNLSNLFFSLFSIDLGFYTLTRTTFRYRIFDDFGVSFRAELILLVLLPIFFVNFITFFVSYKRKIYFYLYEILISAFAVYIWFAKTPDKWISIIDLNIKLLFIPTVYVVYVIAINYKEHRDKLKYIFIGTAALFPCVINDALVAQGITRAPRILHFGFLFFLISLSVQLSQEMVENYQRFINQEQDLNKMEKLKTNFLVNLSSEFKLYIDGIHNTIKEILSLAESDTNLERIKKLEGYEGLTKAIIHDAIVLNQVESGNYEHVTENFSVKELIEETFNILESRHGQRRTNKTISINGEDMSITQSKELFFLMVYHILENAYLYTPPEAVIKVDVNAENKSSILIAITDEGDGIEVNEQEDVFKKFVRSMRDQAKPGVGIGLTLVKSISNFLGGKVTLQTTKGAGSTFTLHIPL